MARILIVDDERAIRESLERALRLEGHATSQAADGAIALQTMSTEPADLIVLDLMMPNIDGVTLTRLLRAEGNRVPILMLTAKTESTDRVAGLDAGADDYLAKPFDLGELLARVRALLRRASFQSADDNGAATLAVGDLRMDVDAHRVWRGDHEIELTRTEFALLELLMRNTGIVLDHSTIYDRIWGFDFGPDSKNLAVYIRYLRLKVERDDLPRLIHTIRGVGYTVRPS